MDAGDYIQAGSTATAAASIGVAWWQVRVAKRAAAEQTRAAHDQVALMRDQLAHERCLRDQAEGPVFEILETEVHDGRTPRPQVHVVLKQTAGTELAEVELAAFLDAAAAEAYGADDEPAVAWHHTAPGAVKAFRIPATARHQGEIEVRLDLRCREEHGDRTWNCRLIAYTRGDWWRNPPEGAPGVYGAVLFARGRGRGGGPRGLHGLAHVPPTATAVSTVRTPVGLLSLVPVRVASPDPVPVAVPPSRATRFEEIWRSFEEEQEEQAEQEEKRSDSGSQDADDEDIW